MYKMYYLSSKWQEKNKLLFELLRRFQRKFCSISFFWSLKNHTVAQKQENPGMERKLKSLFVWEK